MRTLSTNLAQLLAAPDQTFAHVWRVTRADGQAFGFTDHDRDLQIGDLVCRAASAWTPGARDMALGPAADVAAIEGGLDSSVISAADMDSGLWDGAWVELIKVDWRAPHHRIVLQTARLGEIKRGAYGFEAELRSIAAQLNAPIGRVFSPSCDADLGDARCGADLSGSAFSASGVVLAALGPTTFTLSGLSAFAPNWFADGVMRFAGGRWRRVQRHDVNGAIATVTLFQPAGPEGVVGAIVSLRAGCDKRFETCRAKFANSINFRGFPHMPGNDLLAATPISGGRHDGGARAAP